ncbi:MAG: bifunctional serine/threonine-protein kinase/formylglycine-generating enzyme family protein [Gemmataceae bacterium]|nr:bifunctional serine/threonine-protein kinase/formylglycine-generating enzyme family protein [Gemmataceae bacterium]
MPDPASTLFQYLKASALLSDEQLAELQSWMVQTKPDLKTLAQEVHRRGWLTQFQIKEIARGRGASLRLANRYILQDILGEGGMGRVYKARDPRLDRDVAIKVIRREKLTHPATANRFELEIQALSRMTKHPNVVEVFIADQIGDDHYCVMELIDGTDLTKIVRDHGPLPIPTACDIIRQAALGLQHAFETGLVHRDIKPSNILVTRQSGTVKLVDLGLARIIDAPPGGPDAGRITQEGFVIGTPDFLAPEQARNPMTVDIRADIYSLGGTLYYLLTGRVPYEGATPTEKLLKHCTDPPPNLLQYRPEAPPQLQSLLEWCMAKNPDERPQTPLQLAIALQPFCPAPTAGYPPSAGSAPHPVLPVYPPAPAAPAPVAPLPAYPQPLLHAPSVAPAFPQAPLYPPAVAAPTSNSQIFRLPPQTNSDDPIRRRSTNHFPTSLILIGLGTVFVLCVLAVATTIIFLKQPSAIPEPFTNSLGMKMVKLEGGRFTMGSPEDELMRRPDEGPLREVTIRGPFFMSAMEVTNAQYIQLMGVNPARAAKIAASPDNLPVESVSWFDATEFCQKLTTAEKGQPWMRPGWAYRLPTEAEWEYACRAGTNTATAFGQHLEYEKQALFRPTDDDPYEIGGDASKPPRFGQPVGRTKPNNFGLYDMHGNVAEWCQDWYRADTYTDSAADNPTGPLEGERRVYRGGSFREPASAARSAARFAARPREQLDHVGFRVVYAPVSK